MAGKLGLYQHFAGLRAAARASGNLSFIAGIVPGFATFLAGNEQGVYDAATRSLTGRPVSWQISGYQPNGPVEGWNELKGYYRGRKKADA